MARRKGAFALCSAISFWRREGQRSKQNNDFLDQNNYCTDFDERKTETVTVASSLCHAILVFFCGGFPLSIPSVSSSFTSWFLFSALQSFPPFLAGDSAPQG